MASNTPVLYVRNIEQAALWLELDGQISDGMWENARPFDHWQVWCDAEVKVTRNPFQLGRTFYARKDNYNFTSKELLDCVGKRMLGIVRIARRFGIEVASQLEHDVRCEDGMIAFPEDRPAASAGSDWHLRQVAKFEALAAQGATRKELEFALVDPTYTMVMLRADLSDLKHIIKLYVRPEEAEQVQNRVSIEERAALAAIPVVEIPTVSVEDAAIQDALAADLASW